LPIAVACAVGYMIFSDMPVSNIQPVAPISYPTKIPSSPTSRPSSTPSIFMGEPIDYLPVLPDEFDIDYSSQIDATLEDGTKLFSVAFINKQAVFNGNLVRVFYFIYMYSSESKAISKYQIYISDLKAEGKGNLDIGIGIDGADDSLIYIVRKNSLTGEYTSRIKNVVVTTVGVPIYDPQTMTETFIKDFMADVIGFHILGINKFSQQ